MVKFEARRGRIIIHFFGRKYEWTIEPRYWRNPIIALALWLSLPLLLYTVAVVAFNYQPIALMSTLIFANLPDHDGRALQFADHRNRSP